MVFVIFNLAIALLLMEPNMFAFLNTILGFYANCAMAWVVTVAADIVINKYLLKISPEPPEFRRGMLYAVNPVGSSRCCPPGVDRGVLRGFRGRDPAVLADRRDRLALVLTPVMAVLTKGKYYLRRTTTASSCRCSTPRATPPRRNCSAT